MSSVRMNIDGKDIEVEEGMSVLEAAKEAGIEIPTMCYDERLKPSGACRLCMVEITKNGRKKLVASCCYPVEEGLTVNTTTEDVHKIRRVLSELLLAVTPNGTHRELAAEYGITKTRFHLKTNPDSPCTLCGLCVRYCEEVKHRNAVCFVGRGIHRTVALVPGASNDCMSCKECYDFCDSGKMVYLVDGILG